MTTEDATSRRSPIAISVGIIAFVVVIAALRSAATLVIPILLAGFASMVAAAPLMWLRKHRVPTALAIALIVLAMFLVLLGLGAVVGSSVNDFTVRLPEYRAMLAERLAGIEAFLEGHGFDATPAVFDVVDPGRAMHLAVELLNAVSGVLTNVFLILFVTILILFEISDLPAKLRAAFPGRTDFRHTSAIADGVKQYLAIKTVISLVTGAAVWIWVRSIGVDFPIVWGLLAFALNFIPNIGSIMAAIPAVLLAFVQFGPGKALVVALGYVVINVVMGNLIEPRVTGQSVGLSTLVVFLSLLFWGWVFGPVGMLLSVPLTMVIKITLDGNPETRWLAILLDSSVPEESGPA